MFTRMAPSMKVNGKMACIMGKELRPGVTALNMKGSMNKGKRKDLVFSHGLVKVDMRDCL
jgi:hypothetical protein